MISDEMRELLSAYVDGELRDADAARVEEVSKRDAELRREIESYRRMRRKLREWDAAENGGDPSPEMAARAIQRARAWLGSLRRQRKSRVLTLLREPAAVAAALLVAAGLGFLAARGGAPAPAVPVAWEPARAALPAAAPLPDCAVPAVELPPAAAPPGRAPKGELTLAQAIDAFANVAVDGVPMSPRALELREEWRRDDERIERRRQALVRAREEETRTVTPWQPEIAAMIAGYRPEAAPADGLLVLGSVARAPASRVAALPAGERIAMDHASDPGAVLIELGSDAPRLALLGEVFLGERDGSGRTRVLGADGWVRNAQFLPMVWADAIGVPEGSPAKLASPGIVLGPAARRQVLAAKGPEDAAFLEALSRTLRGRTLPEALKDKAAQRQKTVDALLRALRDPAITGFAVVAGGKVLGVELFQGHELLLECAPRLLHGYVLEAGAAAISLDSTAEGAAALEKAQTLLDGLPQRTTGMDDATDVRKDGWPHGLRSVHLRDGAHRIVGHGLVLDGRPVHLTLFGEE